MFVLNIALFLLFNTCVYAKIPPYFSQCSKSDPKVHDCIAFNANGGLYAFVKGDKSYNIKSMLPIYIPQITLHADKDLIINITNSVISDLHGAKIKDARVDLHEKNMEFAMYMPRATLIGQYRAKGKISILPIDESGPINITILHSRVKYHFDYELLDRKENYYINITKSFLTYKSERAYFKFYNLFEGHEFLGDVINESLNENWSATNQELAPSLSNALCDITTKSLKGFFEKVPYQELFSE